MKPKKYRVEYRYHEWLDDDVYSTSFDIEAMSAHDAIGTAWGLMKDEVEVYGGTIDDLEADEIIPKRDFTYPKLAIARHLHAAVIGKSLEDSSDAWYHLPEKDKGEYLKTANRALLEVI